MNYDREAIFYFKMNNSDDLVGEVIHTDTDALGRQTYLIADPMKIEYREINGQQSVQLNRFFNFTNIHTIEVRDTDVTTKMALSEAFTDYYINSVRFNYLYVDRSTNNGVEEMNKVMATAVSSENQKFIAAMKKYNIDADAFIDQLPN